MPAPLTPAAPLLSRWEWELRTAAAAARAAGELLLDYRCRGTEAREKADRSLVTDADLASEVLLLDALRAEFPGDAILSEEAGASGAGARRWIVDPLDGTTNFSRGLPFFAVSLALWEDGAPAVGAVYLPVLDELFLAARDAPATLNGAPIRVSAVGAVPEAMVNVYFDRRERLEAGLEIYARVARACEGRVKTLGSTASLLCYVACGRLDALIKNGTKLPDYAAGMLVLERAGGRVTDFAGRAPGDAADSLLATNSRLHAQLAEIIHASAPGGARKARTE